MHNGRHTWDEPEYSVLVNILITYEMKSEFLLDTIPENMKIVFIPIYII